eukprot:gene1168-7156_t
MSERKAMLLAEETSSSTEGPIRSIKRQLRLAPMAEEFYLRHYLNGATHADAVPRERVNHLPVERLLPRLVCMLKLVDAVPREWVDRLPVERLLPRLRAYVRYAEALRGHRQERRAAHVSRGRNVGPGELHMGCKVKLNAKGSEPVCVCKQKGCKVTCFSWDAPRHALRPGEEGAVITVDLRGLVADVKGPRGVVRAYPARLLTMTERAPAAETDMDDAGDAAQLPGPSGTQCDDDEDLH